MSRCLQAHLPESATASSPCPTQTTTTRNATEIAKCYGSQRRTWGSGICHLLRDERLPGLQRRAPAKRGTASCVPCPYLSSCMVGGGARESFNKMCKGGPAVRCCYEAPGKMPALNYPLPDATGAGGEQDVESSLLHPQRPGRNCTS